MEAQKDARDNALKDISGLFRIQNNFFYCGCLDEPYA